MSLHKCLLQAARRIVTRNKKHRLDPSDAIGSAIAELSEKSAPKDGEMFADQLQRLKNAEKNMSD